uniref:Uncharacterized protein n=1 Tax=Denticeps clupeoides TaxID=299321 RepID=A0AAY4D3B7_9TELE
VGEQLLANVQDVTPKTPQQDGEAEQEPQNPDAQADPLGPHRAPQATGAHGPDQGQVAVHADQQQEEHAAEVVHGYGHVHQLAEQLPEDPVELVGRGDRPEREAEHHDQVGGGQVAQVHVGHRARLPLEAEDGEDEAVGHHAHRADEGEERRLQGRQQPPRAFILAAVLVTRARTRRGDGPVRAVQEHHLAVTSRRSTDDFSDTKAMLLS